MGEHPGGCLRARKLRRAPSAHPPPPHPYIPWDHPSWTGPQEVQCGDGTWGHKGLRSWGPQMPGDTGTGTTGSPGCLDPLGRGWGAFRPSTGLAQRCKWVTPTQTPPPLSLPPASPHPSVHPLVPNTLHPSIHPCICPSVPLSLCSSIPIPLSVPYPLQAGASCHITSPEGSRCPHRASWCPQRPLGHHGRDGCPRDATTVTLVTVAVPSR